MNTRVVRFVLVVTVLAGFCTAYGDLTWSKVDLLPNLWPDSSPNQALYGFPCEVYSATAVYANATGMITVTINTNFKEAGFGGSMWPDSYQAGKVFQPGDLYIAYDADGKYWEPEKIFAVGMADHSGNVVQQAYDDDANWGTVQKGGVYTTPTNSITDWATGTYEGYDSELPGAIPQDADNSGVTVVENGLKPRVSDTDMSVANTYPTMLKNPELQLGTASVNWVLNPAANPNLRIGRYDIVVELDSELLGLDSINDLRDLHFFWTMECGNDGVLLSSPVGELIPEPGTMILLGTVLLGAVGHNIRRRSK